MITEKNISEFSRDQSVSDFSFLLCLIESKCHIINTRWIIDQYNVDIESLASDDAARLLLQISEHDPRASLLPAFRPEWYRCQIADILGADEITTFTALIRHYFAYGEYWDLAPNPFFKPSLFVLNYSSHGAGGRTVMSPFFRMTELEHHFDTTISIYFDSKTYHLTEEENAIIQRVGLTPYSHYVVYGNKERRDPNHFFDEDWYLAQNDLVSEAMIVGHHPNAFSHFLNNFHDVALRPNPFFSATKYLGNSPDLVLAQKEDRLGTPFYHFLSTGFRETRRTDDSCLSQELRRFFDGKAVRYHRVYVPNYHRDELTNLPFDLRNRLTSQEISLRDLLLALDLIAAEGGTAQRFLVSHLSTFIGRFGKPLIEIDSGLPVGLERGDLCRVYIRGSAILPLFTLSSAAIDIGCNHIPSDLAVFPLPLQLSERSNLLELGSTLAVGFLLTFLLDTNLLDRASSHVDVELTFTTEAGHKFVHTYPLGELQVQPATVPTQNMSGTTVAVCMATYNPDSSQLARQVASIVNQVPFQPLLFVSDDRSSVSSWSALQDLERRPNVVVRRNSSNAGFAINFERSLRMLPDDIKYVAFSDQDDEWFDDKLASLISELENGGTILSFSDMLITNGVGEVRHQTFWVNRQPHWESSVGLAIANAVTGAASLGRSDMMRQLIPFPRLRGLYHDQWMAVFAAALGGISFHRTPLYKYMQHGGNVLGFSGSNAIENQKWKALFRALVRMRRRPVTIWNERELETYITVCSYAYYILTERFTLLYEALSRVPKWMDAADQSLADLFCRLILGKSLDYSEITKSWYLLRRQCTKGSALLGIDYLIAACIISRALTNMFPTVIGQKIGRHFADRINDSREYSRIWNNENYTDLERKISPLTYSQSVQCGAENRFNILIPELRVSSFFGGYYTKLALVRRLVDRRVRVRIILIDEPRVNYDEVYGIMSAFPDLAINWDMVEIVAAGSRANSLDFHDGDAIIATTWWSAQIAEQLRAKLNRSTFIYLIQEYEPYTFALGTWYRAAEETYDFPHVALFSTDFLAKHFLEKKAGVFSSFPFGDYMTFRNPIVARPVSSRHWTAGPKRMLFYARPQAHAARNMYEFGLSALRLAVSTLGSEIESWEIMGIGANTMREVSLGHGMHLRLRDKMSYDEYLKLLTSSDVGICLMYTPHPSLVPFEMAAAGLETVTNSCMSKDAASFERVTSRIFVSRPTAAEIAAAISAAVRRVNGRVGDRRADRDFQWPTNPREAFADDFIDKLLSYSSLFGDRKSAAQTISF